MRGGFVGKMTRELSLRVRIAQMIVHNQKQTRTMQLGFAIETHDREEPFELPGARRGFRFQPMTRIFCLHQMHGMCR